MSLDKSLKSKSALARRRNVLSRAERVQSLEEDERWDEEQSVFGLPKVKVARAKQPGRKKAKEKAAEAEAQPEQQEQETAGAEPEE